jgi:hypothetical protein
MKNHLSNAFCATALALAMFAVVGCAAEKAEMPPQMTQDLVTLRDQLVQGKAQVQTTCNAARDLTQRTQAQLQPQVDRLVQSISNLENLATNGRQQVASADERAQAYFAHWDQELASMSDSLAMQGQERREKSEKSFAELKARTAALKANSVPS